MMTKLSYLILAKLPPADFIDRMQLLTSIRDEYKISIPEINEVVHELWTLGYLLGDHKELHRFPDKQDFYKTMRPYYDNEILNLIIEYLFRAGKSASVISTINSGLRLHLNSDDEEYYESLLKINQFVQYTNPGIPTFHISDFGRIQITKFGTYLNYMESLKPKERDEDKIIKYLKRRPVHSPKTSANQVFDDCGIDKKEMDYLLNSMKMDGLIEVQAFIGGVNDCQIWLSNNKSSPPQSIKIETHGHNSPATVGDFKANDIGDKINEETSETKELAKEQLKDLPRNRWYRHWGFILVLIGIIITLSGIICNKSAPIESVLPKK